MNQIKEGQEVYYEHFGYRQKERENEPVATTVTKVGRKWFEVECAKYQRFSIETLRNDSKGYSSSSRIILSLLDYRNEKEYEYLTNTISDFFRIWRTNKPTLEQLRQIAQVLNIGQGVKECDTTMLNQG
jgi:hypothetical protein